MLRYFTYFNSKNGTDGSYNFDFNNMTTINTSSTIPFFQCWDPNITQDDETEIGTAVFSKAYDAFLQCVLSTIKNIKNILFYFVFCSFFCTFAA